MHRTQRRFAVALGAMILTACEGPVGPPGAPGERGPAGPPGTGLDASPASDVTLPTDAVTDALTAPDGAFEAGVAPDPRLICQSCHPGLDVSALNLIGVHDPSSRRYMNNCLHCHLDILNRTTRDARYPEVHRRMLPYTGTFRASVRNEDCVFCHRAVEFGGNRSAANLRRQVAVSACAGCHSNGRWDYYLP